MRLSHIMTGAIQTVAPGASLAEAAKKMASADIGSLPVCADGSTKSGKRVVGIITDRDITVRAVARGLDPNQTCVREVMTREVLSCPADSEVEAACDLMEEKQVRRLVVTDGEDAPIGIVSLGDIALCLRENRSGEVLKRVSEPD
jgi:CBS domain-containing protein